MIYFRVWQDFVNTSLPTCCNVLVNKKARSS